ncbi:LysR family transcriptional regulator [Agrobacterium tumefaciens]|nr:LysR family transcriptional regulator [Agrobacterium tumefaciens]
MRRRRSSAVGATSPHLSLRGGRIPMASLIQTLAVAEHLSFHRAANALGVSQSSVSARIRAQEEDLGILLFERNTRGVRLTEAGRLFVERVSVGVDQLDHAVKTAGMAASGERGRLRIGVYALIPRGFTRGFGGATPSIDDAMAVVLAALSLVGFGIFGPGIANGLVSGGPQLGAGAAVGTALASGGMVLAGAGAVGLAAKGGAAAFSTGAAAVRGGATAAGAASAAYSLGSLGQTGASGVASGMGGVGRAAGSAAISPLRRAAAQVKSSFSDGVKSGFGATGGSSTMGSVSGAAEAPSAPSQPSNAAPGWAQRMRQSGHTGHAVQTAAHAVRSGDSHGSGSSVNLSESDRS